MPLLSHPAFGPRAALAYITLGALTDIWVGVWYFFLVPKDGSDVGMTYFWLTGFGLTGLTLLVIGLLLGRIGQSARRAELPPPEAVAAEAAVQQHAAVVPVSAQPIAPVMPTAPAAPVAPMVPAAPVAAIPQVPTGVRR